MPLYICKLCNISTSLKGNYNRHIKTKKHHLKITCNAENTISEGVMTQNDPKRPKNDPKRPANIAEIVEFRCCYCEKCFSTQAHKRRHELHRCKENPDYYSIINEKKEWRKEKSKLYKQIDALIAKAGNTTTNNLNLNSYGKEDLSHITDTFKTGLLKGPYGMIPKMIKAVHFNDKKPENKNILLTNKKENKIKIFKNGKWEYCKKSDILDDIMNNNYYLLDSHYDDIGKELLNDVQMRQYEKFNNKFSNGNLDKETKEYINLVLLNGDGDSVV